MCEEYKILMNMVIDGEASPEDQWLLEDHLKVCAACRSEYEQLKYIAAQMRDMQEDAPDDLHTTIMAAIKEVKPAIKIPYKFIKSVGIAVAACFVIAAAGVFLPSLGNFAPKADMAAESMCADASNSAAPGMATGPNGGMSYDTTSDKSLADMPTADDADVSSATTDPQDNVNKPGTGANVYLLTCNGVLPAKIDKYNPVYLSGVVVIGFAEESEMLTVYNMLTGDGCSQASGYTLSDDIYNLVREYNNAIVIILG